MAKHITRLFVDEKLQKNISVNATKEQNHHLVNVMRCKTNDTIFVFNGKDGEWNAQINVENKSAKINVKTQIRKQTKLKDIEIWCAPVKKNAMDNIIEKSVEMGAKTIRPVITEFTQTRKLEISKIKNQMIKAAQQCGILTLPQILPMQKLNEAMENINGKPIVFCNEKAEKNRGLEDIKKINKPPVVILVGPEGGFSQKECEEIMKYENTYNISLGPRILKTDTAAIATLALVQASIGDWGDG